MSDACAVAVKEGRLPMPGDGANRQDPLGYFLFDPEGDPPADIAGAIALRAEQWNSSLDPWDAFECWLVEQIAYYSIGLERCALLADALARRRARRAELGWDLDRRAEVAELASKLGRNPERVVRQLARSLHGADLLLSYWRGLGRALEVAGDWDRAQRSMALDLLGTPIVTRDAEARNGLPEDPAGRAELVRREIATLEALRADVLVARDAEDRAAAIAGTSFDDSAEARSLRRHEASCRRALEWARAQLKQGRHGPSGPPSPRPTRPAPPPAPRPSPSPDPIPPPTRQPAPAPEAAAPSLLDQAPEPAPRPATRPPAPMNRRARRAMQKQARRSG